MPDPTSIEEHNTRFEAAYRVTGFGLDGMEIHMPCPCCSAPDFLIYKLDEMHAKMAAGATCPACARTVRTYFRETRDGSVHEMMLVQTGGPPAPEFLMLHAGVPPAEDGWHAP